MYRRTEVYMSGVNISNLHYLEIQFGVFHSFLLPHSFSKVTSAGWRHLFFQYAGSVF